MVELQHRPVPTRALAQFLAANPAATAADFDGLAFRSAKDAVKADLNADQGGLCVYCEKALAAVEGQVEHIKSPKKLIEVALPLDAINVAAAREKSIRHGHPSTLHLWWARRPLAAARAVIFAQMVNDPAISRAAASSMA
jgi:hypothetical protein